MTGTELPAISIVIASYNRVESLRETLEAMTRVKVDGLRVEWVVVDNNSSDATPEVIRSFGGRLPLRHLTERRPGKNCALNMALRECQLGEWVVFTDDDITPEPDWLQEVASAGKRWPNCSVFGGRISPQFSNGGPPAWANTRDLLTFAFCLHDLGGEMPYPKGRLPFGANFWVRSHVFKQGYQYREQIGPHPTDRKMGSETTFLLELERAGFEMRHIPGALVHHRISPAQCSLAALRRRALSYGKGSVHFGGLPNRRLLALSRPLWIGRQLLRMGAGSLGWLLSWMAFPSGRRAQRCLDALYEIGVSLEALHLARHGESPANL